MGKNPRTAGVDFKFSSMRETGGFHFSWVFSMLYVWGCIFQSIGIWPARQASSTRIEGLLLRNYYKYTVESNKKRSINRAIFVRYFPNLPLQTDQNVKHEEQ